MAFNFGVGGNKPDPFEKSSPSEPKKTFGKTSKGQKVTKSETKGTILSKIFGGARNKTPPPDANTQTSTESKIEAQARVRDTLRFKNSEEDTTRTAVTKAKLRLKDSENELRLTNETLKKLSPRDPYRTSVFDTFQKQIKETEVLREVVNLMSDPDFKLIDREELKAKKPSILGLLPKAAAAISSSSAAASAPIPISQSNKLQNLGVNTRTDQVVKLNEEKEILLFVEKEIESVKAIHERLSELSTKENDLISEIRFHEHGVPGQVYSINKHLGNIVPPTPEEFMKIDPNIKNKQIDEKRVELKFVQEEMARLIIKADSYITQNPDNFRLNSRIETIKKQLMQSGSAGTSRELKLELNALEKIKSQLPTFESLDTGEDYSKKATYLLETAGVFEYDSLERQIIGLRQKINTVSPNHQEEIFQQIKKISHDKETIINATNLIKNPALISQRLNKLKNLVESGQVNHVNLKEAQETFGVLKELQRRFPENK